MYLMDHTTEKRHAYIHLVDFIWSIHIHYVRRMVAGKRGIKSEELCVVEESNRDQLAHTHTVCVLGVSYSCSALLSICDFSFCLMESETWRPETACH